MKIFKRKSEKTEEIIVNPPLVMARYKEMLPEFKNYAKSTSPDSYRFASDYEKRAVALETLLSLSISREDSSEVKALFVDANLKGINHDKIKKSQEGFYTLATNASLQNAFDVLEESHWEVAAFKQIIKMGDIGAENYSNIVYGALNTQIVNAAQYSSRSGDKELEKLVKKLQFKILMIKAKDPSQDLQSVYKSAVFGSTYLSFMDKDTNLRRDELVIYYQAKLRELCDSKPEKLKESDRRKISIIVDEILDSSTSLANFMTKEERGVIPTGVCYVILESTNMIAEQLL